MNDLITKQYFYQGYNSDAWNDEILFSLKDIKKLGFLICWIGLFYKNQDFLFDIKYKLYF